MLNYSMIIILSLIVFCVCVDSARFCQSKYFQIDWYSK